MSFQAYLDNREEKTGKTPAELIELARKPPSTLVVVMERPWFTPSRMGRSFLTTERRTAMNDIRAFNSSLPAHGKSVCRPLKGEHL